MADDLERALRGVEAAREFARSYRFEMTAEYRALIAHIEGLTENRPGSDKSGVWAALRAYIDSFSRVERARHP